MLRSPFTPDSTMCSRDRHDAPDNTKPNNGPPGPTGDGLTDADAPRRSESLVTIRLFEA